MARRAAVALLLIALLIMGTVNWTTGAGETAAPATRRVPARAAATRRDDLELLARVVTAEAKGEPYEGQVAVAAAILNRVRDPRFPNTLAGVIYQANAFETVTSGEIYQAPSPTSRRAAQDALNGWDPTGGAVFFWNAGKTMSSWIWSRPIIKRIGRYVFAR